MGDEILDGKRPKKVIGRIRILGTSKNVGVIGVSKTKKKLELEKSIVIKKDSVSKIDREQEGVLWCWLPAQVPSKDKIVSPTLLSERKRRYVNILSTSYVFAAVQKSNFIRLFCTLDGNSIAALPENIYEVTPTFPHVKIDDENITWQWFDTNHKTSLKKEKEDHANQPDSKQVIMPGVASNTNFKEINFTTSPKKPEHSGAKDLKKSDTISVMNPSPSKPYIFINKIQSVPGKINDILRHAKEKMCVFDCEGVNLSATGELTLLQIAYESSLTNNIECVIFDILSLKKITKDGGEVNKGLLKSSLQKLFGNNEFKKYAHDFRMDIAALSHQLGISANNIFDTQIMYELCTGNMFGSLNSFLKLCEIEEHMITSGV